MFLGYVRRWLVQPVLRYNHSCYNHMFHDLLLHSGIDVHIFYKFYRPSFFSGNPLANHLRNLVHGQQMIPHIFLIILLLLNPVEKLVRVLSSPSTIIFNSPITGLYLPISWNFIFHRERWNAPY